MKSVVGPWPDPEVPTFDTMGYMVPPWVKYPNLPKASMGWRMGLGEEYWGQFQSWWWRQLRETRKKVRVTYPEPQEWADFYHNLH